MREIGDRRIARRALRQLSSPSMLGSLPSWNVSGKKYGRKRPSVYRTPGMSEIMRSVVPSPTDPTTASRPSSLNPSMYGSVPIHWSPRNIIASLPAACVSSTSFLTFARTNVDRNAIQSRCALRGMRHVEL